MKKLTSLIVLFITIYTQTVVWAQTGPGGVGNSNGTSGQPRNVLWLDAGSLSYSDGNDLSTWLDLSGNNNDLAQPTPILTPIFKDNVTDNVNGHPIAEFSKSNNRIVLNPFGDMPTSGITTFFIYRTTDSGDGLISYNTASRDNAFLLFDNNNLRTYVNGNTVSGANLNSGSWQIMSHKWNSSGGNLIINLDGDQAFSATHQNGASIPTGGSLAIGGEQDSPDGGYDPNQDFDGDIAEVIMYNSFLNAAQRILVENYLSEKYNLAFATASNDKFGNDGDFNSNYIYNIAGIGQEVDGAHTQTVSGGFYIYEWNSTLANGEYVMLGHDNTTNNSTTTYTGADLPVGTDASWARQWYVEKSSSDGIDVKLIFDFKEALSDGQYPANVANYVLLHRDATTGAYSKVTVAGQGVFDADQVYFDIEDANFANGYYTIGTDDQANSPIEGVADRTWYALASGDWDDWNYWTLDPSGALPNNPDNETPSAIDQVVIHTGKTITLTSNTKTLASITVDGILQLGTTTGHNFTTIKGSGRIRLASDNFPTGDASHFVTAGLGEGTVVWQGGSYNLSLATGSEFFNMEFDLGISTNTLTLLSDLTINGGLIVETGILQINNATTTNLNLEVKGNVIVEANGQILTGTGNARHQFDFYGDFTNAGTIEFTNNASADYNTLNPTYGIVDANFLNTSANQTILCNGTTNFYRIEIDKGTDDTYILDIQASAVANFNLFGYANQGHGEIAQLISNTNALGLLKGTVKIGSNVNIPHLNSGGNYNISEAAQLWVTGGTVTKPSSSGQAIVPYGVARISSGTFESLVSSGFTTRDNGLIKVEGGTMNTNQIRTSVLGLGNVGGYVQSGGTVNIINPGTTQNNYYHFSMTYPGNTFSMSGGTLHVYDANGTATNQGGIFIASDPENVNVTGGTVIADISGTTNSFKITSTAPFYNLILRNSAGNASDHVLDGGSNINGTADADLAAQPLVTLNDLTIEGTNSSTLVTNNLNVSVGRNLRIEEGATYDYGTNTTIFNGTEDGELYIGHSTGNGYEQLFYDFTVNKPVGKTLLLTGDSQKEAANVSPLWNSRLVQITNDFNLESGTFNQGEHSIRLFGTAEVKKDGICGVYNHLTTETNASIVLRGDGLIIQTENGAQFGNVKIDVGSPGSDEIAFTSDVYIKRIGYTDGRVNLGIYNIKVDYLHDGYTTDRHADGGANEMFYGAGNASDGGLSLLIIENGTYIFPLGVSGKYTPAEVIVTDFDDDGYIQIRPVDGELKTTDLAAGDLLDYYWRVGHEDFTTNPTVQYQFVYDNGDIVGAENGYYPGKVLDENPYTRSYEAQSNLTANNNTITFNDTGGTSGNTGNGFTLEKANYTAGVANRFTGTVDKYYSYYDSEGSTGNGWYNNWNSAATWDKGSVGSGVHEVPLAGSIVYIQDRARVWGNNIPNEPAEVIFEFNSVEYGTTDQENVPRLQFNSSGPWNLGRVSGIGMVSFNNNNDPIVSADWGEFANNSSNFFMYWGADQVHTNIIQPCPSLMIEGSTQTIDQNIIVSGNLILTGNTNCIVQQDILIKNDLYPGAWSNGFLHFPNSGSPVTMTVDGNLDYTYINTSGNRDVVVDNIGNNIEHNLIIKGDIIQGSDVDYELDLYSAQGETNVILELQGASNNSYYRASTSVPDFYRIIMNKGAGQTNSFTFSDDVTLSGVTSGLGVSKALELQNGILILDDVDINFDLTTGDDNFSIPSTAELEIRQGQVNANGNSGILLDGKLLVSGGTVDMIGGDNYIQYSASGNAEIEVTGGTLQVGSQIRRGTSSTEGVLKYTQNGGTVIVGENSAPEGTRGVFEILNTGSSFTHTGGDLHIVRQQTNPTFATLYLDPETSDLTGSTITLGHTGTPVNQEFGIYSTINLNNLVLNTTNSPVAKMWTIPLSINGELTLQSGTEFNANGLDLNLYGDFTNSGIFTANENTTYIKGTSDQEFDGNTTFYNLTNQNTTNLNLAAGNTDITVDNILSLESGTTLNDNSNNISVFGDIYNDATHVYGGTGDGISMLGSSQQVMTGDGTYGKLTINNGAGVTLPVGNAPTITNFLKLEAGIFNIAGNLLTLDVNCQIQEANPFSKTNMIQTNISFTDNGVKKYFPAGVGSFIYPMGSGGKYTPIIISVTQNTSAVGYLIVKPSDEIHPSIIEDSEAPDPEIVDKDNVLQYYWVFTANGFTDASGTVEFYYDDGDVEVTPPYDITNYITAKLLSDGAGNWTKFDDVSKFDQTLKKLIFDFANAADVDISGDYTAGVDGSTFLGAIPDEVPLYASNGLGGTMDWFTASTWRVDDGTGTWVLPASIGLPDIPKGSRVRILVGDEVQTSANYISAYTTEILGTLDVNTTFGNRVGNVSGAGTLYTEVGNLPAGYYETFFSSTGGTVEFGGSTNYSVLSNITQVNNLTFSGTGDRELPNLNLTVLGDLLFSDVSGSSPDVINEFDRKVSIMGDITFNAGTFDAGTESNAIIELNGSSTQTISGLTSFTGTNAFYHFIMNNVNGVTLSSPIDIDQTLTFTEGIIITNTTNILSLVHTGEGIVTGAGSGKYVDGPLRKNILSTQGFNFPVGDAGRFGSISILSSSVSDYWELEYMNHNPNDDGYDPTSFNTPLTVVSDSEYWRIDGPSANARVSLRYDGQSGIPSDANMKIAEWKPPATSAWEEFVSNAPSGGTVTSTGTTAFTSGTEKFFTLSSIYVIQTPTWNGSMSTVWNLPANWDNNAVPNSLDDIDIPNVANDPVIGISAECRAITLASSATLTINAGNSLTAYGDFSNAGTLILKSPSSLGAGGSFIDNGTITGTGTVQVERYITSHEYHYISAPIDGGNADSDLFTAHGSAFNANFYSYDETVDLDGNPSTAPPGVHDPDNLIGGWNFAHNGDGGAAVNMTITQGYSFYTDINGAVTFQGVATTLNTGDQSVSGLSYEGNDPMPGPLPGYYDGWHLVGNPYPSAIDWDLIRGSLTNLDDAIYVWDGTQYASYVAGVSGGTLNQDNYIAPMQGFFVHANADNAGFNLNNSHRTHSPATNFKRTKSSVPDNFIRLRMEANGKSDAMVVYFKSNATEEFDGVYDAFRLFSWNNDPANTYNNDVPHLFTVTPKEKVALSISALPERIIGDVVIPLGVRIGTTGEYTITKDQLNIPNVNVYLIDKLENTSVYLNTENSYTFNYTAGDVRDRFELRTQLNNAPVVNSVINNKTVNEKDAFSFTFVESAFIEYNEGDHIVSYAATLADGSELPAWLSFDQATRTFSGTPANYDVGIISVQLSAIDVPGAEGMQVFDIEVINVNDAPELVNSIADLQATEDVNFELVFSENTFTDIDANDVLTYSAKLANGADLPVWLTFNKDTRTFTGLPENSDVAILDVQLTATDQSGENVSDIFVLEVVNVNDAPELVNEIPDQEIDEGYNYTYTIPSNTFNDIDLGDVLKLSAKQADGTGLPTWMIFDLENGRFYGTAENVGDINIVVTAMDTEGASTSDEFTLTVKGATGIMDISSSEVLIYPNPTQGAFFVKTDYYSDDLMIYVRDFSGRIIKQVKPEGKETEINISEFSSGMYFIELNNKVESRVFKINLNK